MATETETIVGEETGTTEATAETQQTEQATATTETTSTETTQEVDWRSRMAGDDEKLLGFLGRYQSERAFVEAAKKDREAAKAASRYKPLPDAPTDEELAAYRKDNGIPDSPDGYMSALPDGLVVGDDDKPFVDQFMQAMHGANANPQVTAAALETYYNIVEEQAAQEAEMVKSAEREAIEELRTEWGADYRRNLNIMTNHLQTLPEAVRDAFTYGRGSDGKPLGYNPEILRWLTAQALEVNPVATVVPNAGADQAGAIATEMASLEAMMGDKNSKYWKGPEAAKHQARYVQLVEAKQKLG